MWRSIAFAAPLVALVACNGNEVASGTVTVTIRGPSVAGVEVWFQDENADTLGNAVTDDTGIVIGPIHAGGSVTALDPFGHDDQIGVDAYTYTDVQPGDEIVVAHEVTETTVPTSSTVITLPLSSDPTIDQYQVFPAGCSSGAYTPTISNGLWTNQIDLYGCGPTVDLLIIAHDFDNQAQPAREWAYLPDVVVGPTTDATGITWAPFTTQTLTFRNVTPQELFYARSLLSSPRGFLWNAQVPPGATSLTAAVPNFPGAIDEIFVNVNKAENHHVIIEGGGPLLPTVDMDVGARLLSDASSCPVYFHDDRRSTWDEATAGAPPDYVELALDIEPHFDGARWRWHILGPYSGNTFELPTMPRELDLLQIRGLDFYAVRDVVRGKLDGGYEALRTRAIWRSSVDFETTLLPTGAVSTVTRGGCPAIDSSL